MTGDNLRDAIRLAKHTEPGEAPLDRKAGLAEGLKLVERSKICLLGTNGENGFPNIKAMLNLKHDGLKKVWFSTNTSSKRVRQIFKDKRACVYYLDEGNFEGLMLTGVVEVQQDLASKRMLWTEGAEVYYPRGVEDPDYSVLCFSATRGNYYHRLQNVDFDIE